MGCENSARGGKGDICFAPDFYKPGQRSVRWDQFKAFMQRKTKFRNIPRTEFGAKGTSIQHFHNILNTQYHIQENHHRHHQHDQCTEDAH